MDEPSIPFFQSIFWIFAICSTIAFTIMSALFVKTKRPTKLSVHAATNSSHHANTMIQAVVDSDALEFRPPRVLTNGHVSTLYSSLAKRAIPPPYDRVHIRLEDGGTLGLDIVEPCKRWNRKQVRFPPKLRNPPTVIIMPGLGGSCKCKFVRSTVRTFYERGWRVVVQNYRGCETLLTSCKTFSAGYTDDLAETVRYLKRTYPSSRLMGVGFSMGANTLLCYLGTKNEDKSSDLYHAIEASATFSNFFLLSNMYAAFRKPKPILRIYEKALLKHVTKPWRTCENLDSILCQQPELDRKILTKAKNFWEYDLHTLPIIYGYEDMNIYYERESSGLQLSKINVPCFMMNARDDPLFFRSTEDFVRREVESNSNLVFVVTEWGGHNGWDRRLVPSMKPKVYQSLMEHVAEKVLGSLHSKTKHARKISSASSLDDSTSHLPTVPPHQILDPCFSVHSA